MWQIHPSTLSHGIRENLKRANAYILKKLFQHVCFSIDHMLEFTQRPNALKCKAANLWRRFYLRKKTNIVYQLHAHPQKIAGKKYTHTSAYMRSGLTKCDTEEAERERRGKELKK